MRNFRFSLERILSWRRTELQAEEARLAALFTERSRLDGRRAEIRDAREGASRRLWASGAVDGSELESLQGYRQRLEKELVAVEHTRDITKTSMVHNGATPDIKVDAETYEVTADGELLTCAPAEVLPMAQRYFLF